MALAWIEASGAALVNDLDLGCSRPRGDLLGNYFTDDNNRNRSLDAGEDCPGIDGTVGELDAAPWSLPTSACINAVRDIDNPTEAIMLSPDYDGDGGFDLDPDDDNQLELGTWTISVESAANAVGDTAQRYAVPWQGASASARRFGSTTVSTPATTGPDHDQRDRRTLGRRRRPDRRRGGRPAHGRGRGS